MTSVSLKLILKRHTLTIRSQGFDRALEQSSDSIRAKASWLKRDRGDVEGWLAENGYLAKVSGKL